jgi:hypothetical protein
VPPQRYLSHVKALAIAAAVAALVAAGCGGKNEKPKAVGGATTGVASVPQNGGVARYAYPSALAHAFTTSCRHQRGGTDSACTCVLDHLKQNTPTRQLRQLVPLGRGGAPGSAQKKLRAAGRSCGIRL